jgi:putative heme transporter
LGLLSLRHVATLGLVARDAQEIDGAAGTARLRVTPALAFAVVGAVVGAFALQRGFVLAHRTLGWAVACGVVALLLDPVVHWLALRIPRVLAIVIAIVGIIAVVSVMVVQVVSELTTSVKSLGVSAPIAAARLENRSSVARNLHLVDTIKSFSRQLASDVNQGTIARVKTAPTYLVTGILMLFLLVHGRRYLRSILGQIPDADRRARATVIVRNGLSRGRNRLLLTLLQIVVVTLAALVVFAFIDLRAQFILALLLGLASVMPFVGLLVAGVPAAVMAYGFHGLKSALVVGVFVAVVEVIDLGWWRRSCDRTTVEIGLFVPVVATLLGYRLYSIGGAVYGYALVVLLLALIGAADADRDHNPATWGGTSAGPDVVGGVRA